VLWTTASERGFEHDARRVLSRFAETYENYQRIVVLSASCAVHVKSHAATHVADRTTEFCAFLHDDVGLVAVSALGISYPRQVALHIGCHGLHGLGPARPSEIQSSSENKVQALLETVRGLTFAKPARTDECFGGTFAVAEPAISAEMGRDRIRDYRPGGARGLQSNRRLGRALRRVRCGAVKDRRHRAIACDRSSRTEAPDRNCSLVYRCGSRLCHLKELDRSEQPGRQQRRIGSIGIAHGKGVSARCARLFVANEAIGPQVAHADL
jgi:hypothetical protein